MLTAMASLKERLRDNMPLLVSSTLAVMFLVAMFFNYIFINIPPGHAGVLWLRFFGGTVVDQVRGEGLHVILPWDKIYVYDLRIQELAQDFKVLTRNGLEVNVRVSTRFNPEYSLLGALHQQVGPDYAQRVIAPTVESVVRMVVGKQDIADLYSSSSLISKAVIETSELVARRFINLDTVLITQVQLPPSIQEVVQYKMEQFYRLEAYEYILEKERKEAERKSIEAAGQAQYNSILGATLTPDILKYRGIQATEQLATSQNAKVVVVGGGKDGLPLILGTDR